MRTRRILACLLFLFAFVSPTSAAVYLVPRGSTTGFVIGYGIGNALRSAVQATEAMRASNANLSAQIAEVRRKFWVAYPKGSDLNKLEEDYARLLFAKDFQYFSFYLPEGPRGVAAKFASRYGGEVDGGIPEDARPAFVAWVYKVREALGGKTVYRGNAMTSLPVDELIIFTPDKLLAALDRPEVQKAYDDYKTARDRAEFARAGHRQDFDDMQEKLVGTSELSPPEVLTDSLGPGTQVIKVQYASVPEKFRPDLAIPLSENVTHVIYDMPKKMEGSLRRIMVSKFYGTSQYQLKIRETGNLSPGKRQEIQQVSRALAMGGALLLECNYATAVKNVLNVRYFWHHRRPPAADPAVLDPVDGNRLLLIGEPKENCPITLAAAQAAAVASGPVTRHANFFDRKGLRITYSETPDDFVPKTDAALSDEVTFIWIETGKTDKDALYKMNVWKGLYVNTTLKTAEVMSASPSVRNEMRKATSVANTEGAAILECEYIAHQDGSGKTIATRNIYYWYKQRPQAADLPEFKTTPLRVIRDARDSCPARENG
jgi:hypothetical protein